MPNIQDTRPGLHFKRRSAPIGLGILGLGCIGLLGLWWAAALKTPMVAIPKPIMPTPNAFDLYVAAGRGVTSGAVIGNAAGTTPPPFSLAQEESLVQQNIGAIQTLHEGFGYTYLHPANRSFDTYMPYYGSFRSMARLLLLQGKVRAEQGDWSGAFDTYLDTMRMGEDIPRGGPLISDFVGIACQGIGRRDMWGAIDHLNVAQSRAAITRMETVLGRRVPFGDVMQEEKWAVQASLLEVFANPKKRAALLTPPNASGPAATRASSLAAFFYFAYSKNMIMHNYTNYMDQITAQARQPYGRHLPPPPTPSDPINRVVLPPYADTRLKDVACETQNDFVLVMLALHAYQLEHGHYPASLAELAPTYLKKLPDDPFGVQGPFKYRVEGKSYLLYSVGPDGKDDGGKMIDDLTRVGSGNPNYRYFIETKSVGDVVAGKNRW